MAKENKHYQDVQEIKKMMERSSRFLSLSGLSGVSTGVIALLGALTAYIILDLGESKYDGYFQLFVDPFPIGRVIAPLIILGISVLVLALSFGFFFSWRKARKQGHSLWDYTTRRLLYHLFIPLIAGGFFCLILIDRNDVSLLASATLIFYGLALVNISKYTYREIQYLGISEIILGIFAGVFIHFGLIFWAIGFGVFHILYGLIMYYRYEK